jgi:hypothetical protein
MIGGIGMMHLRYGATVESKSLAKKLAAKGTLVHIAGEIKTLQSMKRWPSGHCAASLFVDAYNLHLRSGKLEPWNH